jgi:general secretion pathway protein G
MRIAGRLAGGTVFALILCLFLFKLVAPYLSGHGGRHPLPEVHRLREALDLVRLDIGRYPTAEEGLAVLVTPPQDEDARKLWHGPYIKGALPLDPWRHPYHYSPVAKSPDSIALYSDGPPGSLPGQVIGYPPSD